ncbi:MAG: DUF4358 domain-containing protein [Clostridium sp.]
MRIFKKILITLLVGSLIIGSLTACSKGSESKDGENPPVADIEKKIGAATQLKYLEKVNEETLNALYGISKDEVSEYIGYYSPMNVKADEIIVIKAKDKKDMPALKEKIQKRVKMQDDAFKRYLPEVYDLIQNHVIKENGKYIIMTISPDAEAIAKAFNESLK